ncbi:hypothetical protein F7018_11610 [Tenacibaculum aiptasiae]|uniref:Uncharacterized protein n=1 Tax=Tenacibaculum aiptasiae TaxID=426481 RepID=A0A7J5AET0_9FLAO|nr:hypothetical protein [Tenacibaculum aiptasiae]KAB1155948.1 hypothetical protein F7018_11610 [Tenacibaculum aiptasiae]
MVGELITKYNVSDWFYLNIDKQTLLKRYDWINIYIPDINLNYPWAVINDIERLFYLCISFDSKSEVLKWFSENSELVLIESHIKLVDLFSYQKIELKNNIDYQIEECNNTTLLNFITLILERSLLWYSPEPTWPSSLYSYLVKARKIINHIDMTKLKPTNDLVLKGEDLFDSTDYTHVFYKFKNICNQIDKGEIYSDLTTITKQAHLTLITSIRLNLEYQHNTTKLTEIEYERKIDDIIKRETNWCLRQLNMISKTKHNKT